MNYSHSRATLRAIRQWECVHKPLSESSPKSSLSFLYQRKVQEVLHGQRVTEHGIAHQIALYGFTQRFFSSTVLSQLLSFCHSTLQHLKESTVSRIPPNPDLANEQEALPGLTTHFVHRQYGMMRDSPYVGAPTLESDQAWDILFSNMSLRVSASELSQHSQSSVALPEGGYLAWLGVYHELHCMKVLRQINYREYYHPNLSAQGLRNLQVHADHCIDLLREALMCHGDTESLTTFVWSEGWEKPLLSPQRPKHRCLDWDLMVDSMRLRIVGDAELNRLTPPT